MEPEEPNPMPEIEDYTPKGYDKYVGAQIMLPAADGWIKGTIVKRAKNEAGNPNGRRNNNPFLDTIKYKVQLSDGTTDEYYANIIAENLFSQVNSERRQYVLMKERSDHRCDDTAVHISDGWLTMRNGQKVRKRTTRGWQLLVVCKGQ
jgi:hypothetical protein